MVTKKKLDDVTERVKWVTQDNVHTTRQAIFGATVTSGKIIKIVHIYISLVGGTPRTDLEDFDGDSTYTPFIRGINLTAAQNCYYEHFPTTDWDPEKPMYKLQVGHEMYVNPTGGTVDISVAYTTEWK